MDFNLEEKLKKGIRFSEIFRSLFLYSASICIAFYWSDLLKESLITYFPQGQGIMMKISVGTFVTVTLICAAYLMMHDNHKSEEVK